MRRSPLSLRQELARKTLHLATAGFPVAYALGAPRAVIVAALAVVSVVALAVEALRRTNAGVQSAFERTFGAIVRQHEARAITGATWLALSCLVVVLLLSRNAAIAALWCATAGDPAATLFGRWMAPRAPDADVAARKTMAGSMACLVVSFGGVWMIAGYAPAIAAPIAVVATLAEFMPVTIDDNVRVAAAAGAMAQILT